MPELEPVTRIHVRLLAGVEFLGADELRAVVYAIAYILAVTVGSAIAALLASWLRL